MTAVATPIHPLHSSPPAGQFNRFPYVRILSPLALDGVIRTEGILLHPQR